MPVQPDPTHPKLLEGDDMLMPPTETEDGVEGAVRDMDSDDPGADPGDIEYRTATNPEDAEGHFTP